jgi:hypothetical protein
MSIGKLVAADLDDLDDLPTEQMVVSTVPAVKPVSRSCCCPCACTQYCCCEPQ